jgi:beta-phosphoglucomutase
VKKLPFSAVIFDLDGLVLDTESTYFRAWRRAAEQMGYDFSSISHSDLSGLHYQAVMALLLKNFGADFNSVLFNQLSSEYWRVDVTEKGIAQKKGFDTLLKRIQNQQIPFCLATNSPKINVQECLTFAGLEHVFSIIVSRDDVKQGKPAPDIFLKAAEHLQQPIETCLILEDSRVGIQAAEAAGAIPVLIPSFIVNTPILLSPKVQVFADLHHVATALF